MWEIVSALIAAAGVLWGAIVQWRQTQDTAARNRREATSAWVNDANAISGTAMGMFEQIRDELQRSQDASNRQIADLERQLAEVRAALIKKQQEMEQQQQQHHDELLAIQQQHHDEMLAMQQRHQDELARLLAENTVITQHIADQIGPADDQQRKAS